MTYFVKSRAASEARVLNPGKSLKPVTGFEPREITNPVREYSPENHYKPVTDAHSRKNAGLSRNIQQRGSENPWNSSGKSLDFPGSKAGTLNFPQINRVALGCFLALLARWLPDGQLKGREWIARNPTRADKRPGSFCINVDTGKWSDFATGDRGGDVVSLAAYLSGTTQGDAAKRLADHLGVRHD